MIEQQPKPVPEARVEPPHSKSGLLTYLKASQRPSFALIMFVLLLSALILFLRRPDALLNPQLYAEDGVIFLAQQRTLGTAAIFTPYAGYYHLAPRLIALIADQFPVYYAPIIYNGAALIIFLLVILFVLLNSPGSSLQKFGFALTLTLIPHAGEVLINTTNINWILAATIPFLYAQRTLLDWKRTALTIFLVIMVGLSGPAFVLTCPLLLVRVAQQKRLNVYEVCFCVASLLIVIIHGACLWRELLPAEPASMAWADWLRAIFERFGGYLYFGKYLPRGVPIVTALAAAVLLFVTPLTIPFIRREWRSFALLTFVFGIIIFSATMKKFAHAPLTLHPMLAGPRYYFLPYLSFFCLYLILAWDTRWWLRRLGRVCVLLLLLSAVTSFRVPPLTDYYWKENISRLAVEKHVIITIPPGWTFELNARAGE